MLGLKIIIEYGHLSWGRVYHIVIMVGLNCLAHFAVTDTAATSFFVARYLD